MYTSPTPCAKLFVTQIYPRQGIACVLNVSVQTVRYTNALYSTQALATDKTINPQLVTIVVRDRIQVPPKMQTMQKQCTQNARKALNTIGAHFETMRMRVLQRSHVMSCVAATAKIVGTLTCSLAIAHILLGQVFRTLVKNATTYCHLAQSRLLRVLYIGCTTTTSARTCNIMHRRLRIRRDSRNSLRH